MMHFTISKKELLGYSSIIVFWPLLNGSLQVHNICIQNIMSSQMSLYWELDLDQQEPHVHMDCA